MIPVGIGMTTYGLYVLVFWIVRSSTVVPPRFCVMRFGNCTSLR